MGSASKKNQNNLLLYNEFFKKNWSNILFSSIVIFVGLLFYSYSGSGILKWVYFPVISIIVSTIFHMERKELPLRVVIYILLGVLLGSIFYLSRVEPKLISQDILIGVVLVLLVPFLIRIYLWIRSKIGDFL